MTRPANPAPGNRIRTRGLCAALRTLFVAGSLLLSSSLASALDVSPIPEFGSPSLDEEALRPELALFEGVRPLTSLLRDAEEGEPWWERAPATPAPPRHAGGRLPARTLLLDFESPLDHFESNARLWYSFNQLLGRGNDALGRGLGLDGTPLGRIGLFLAAAWGSGALTYYSHETAHTFEDRNVGVDAGFRVDPSRWVAPGIPRYRMEVARGELVLAPEQEARAVAAGLAQTAFDARILWARSTLAGERDWIGALAFLEGMLDPLLQIEAGILTASRSNDVNRAVALARDAGIPLTRRRILAQCLLADALSLPLWENLLAVGRFVASGDRSVRPLRLLLGRGVSLAPPVFHVFLTPRGGFAEGSFFLFHGRDRAVELSVGRRADFQGSSRVRGVLLAARAHGWLEARAGGATVSLTPSLSGRFGEGGALTGGLAGLELAVGIAGAALTLRLETGRNDAIRHEIQGEKEGFRAVLGLELRL